MVRVEGGFLDIFGRSNSGPQNLGEDDRIKAYKEKVLWLGNFDEDLWFDEAIETEVRGLKDSKKGLCLDVLFYAG